MGIHRHNVPFEHGRLRKPAAPETAEALSLDDSSGYGDVGDHLMIVSFHINSQQRSSWDIPSSQGTVTVRTGEARPLLMICHVSF